MKEKINKPRAFISYSSLDSTFIEKIESSLRSCQIEPWRDHTEIRDGRPWLDSIFEEGLPTCDVIIAYFTSNSLNSDMVAREVDAAQLRLLSDKGVSFLPYVDHSDTRKNLRLDLKTLHCRVWNAENFYEVLPSVVAEIWRSYAERVVGIAVAQERTRRLEAELELKDIRSSLNDSAFTAQEEREFQYVHGKVKGLKDAVAKVYANRAAGEKVRVLGTCRVKVSFVELLKRRIDKNKDYFGDGFLDDIDDELRSSHHIAELLGEGKLGKLKFITDFTPTLRIHALLTESKKTLILNEFEVTNLAFSDKMYRFISWLDYYELFGPEPLYEIVEFSHSESET